MNIFRDCFFSLGMAEMSKAVERGGPAILRFECKDFKKCLEHHVLHR